MHPMLPRNSAPAVRLMLLPVELVVFYIVGKILILVHEHLGEVKEYFGRDHTVVDGGGIDNLL